MFEITIAFLIGTLAGFVCCSILTLSRTDHSQTGLIDIADEMAESLASLRQFPAAQRLVARYQAERSSFHQEGC
jgi:hypothetical protein